MSGLRTSTNLVTNGHFSATVNGTGSVVITAFSATHVAGTFSFDATPIPGTPATVTLHVRKGASI